MDEISELYRIRVLSGDLKPDPAQAEIIGKLDALATKLGGRTRRFGRHETARGLYIHGPVGRGKSMLMDLFFAAAPVQQKRRVHFNAFMLEVHRHLNDARGARRADPLAEVAAILSTEARLLCFDEFQVKDIADAMILSRLFTALIDRGVVVVATSNLPPEDLYAGGLQRDLFLPFIALIRRRMDVAAMADGVDYRLARLAGNPVWFAPDDATAMRAMDGLFAELTTGHEPAPTALDVAGHTVTVPLQTTAAARFTFDDLCRQPMGAADYLALASLYRVLLVDHIPLLDPAARNETVRFIILIDQLYENRTVLVASAAAAPEALYPANGPYAFEFARTVSRLAEMASAGYVAALDSEKIKRDRK